MVKYSLAALDDVFFALSDPTRRAILERLAEEGQLMVTALAAPFEMSLPAVSKHLRVLERAGLLVQEKDGRIRRCQLVAEPLQGAAEWIEQYRQFWENQLDNLADYLDQVQQQGEGQTNERGANG
jgi:DNA-binding transcriptional ArsR family regulator